MGFRVIKQRPLRNMDPQQDQWLTPGWPTCPWPQPLYPPLQKTEYFHLSS